MRFVPTDIDGVVRIVSDRAHDERGFFGRTFCETSFRRAGLVGRFEQSSLSSNRRAATLRGMHYQEQPHAETKLVRCVRGAIFDVAVDLRAGSATRGQWTGAVLSQENGDALYIPPGFAHGFQTLEDQTDVLYQITPEYQPGKGLGVRWNDPAFAIAWPLPDPILSERDATYPDAVL